MLGHAQLLQLIVVSFLTAASISDIRKREVPNWVNYGLTITGFGLGLLHSVVTMNWTFLLFSVLGAAAALALAAIMFYTGQWGGGDSKLLIGMGAAVGFSVTTTSPFASLDNPFISFLFNLVVVSLVYAIVFGIILAFKHKKQFSAALNKQLESYAAIRKVVLVACALGLLVAVVSNDVLVRFAALALAAISFLTTYLSIMSKAVERACLLKNLSPLKLTEGDWIAKDIVVDGKRICGPKDLGIDKSQIRKLIALYRRKKIRVVLVKEGLPFAPTFLIAYIITVFFGNLFLAVLR